MLWDTFCVCLKLVEKPPNLTVDHDFPMRIAQGSRPFGPLAPDCCRADIFSSLILLEVTMTHGLGSGTHSIWRPVTHATSRYVWSHYAASNSGIVHPCTLFIGPLLRPWHAFELMNGMISPYWTTNRYRMDHDGGIPSWPNILASPGLLDCRWRWCLLPQGCGRAQGEMGSQKAGKASENVWWLEIVIIISTTCRSSLIQFRIVIPDFRVFFRIL
jgi:hypothetical protein